MSPKLKKTNQNLNDKKEVTDEKENKKSNIKTLAQKSTKGKVQFVLEVPEQSVTSSVNRKPLGFWSKKVQDLEENETKKKKSALYEFSGTDESDSSFRTKKKIKRKPRLQRKKQPSAFNKKSCVKTKKKFPELAMGVMKNPKQPPDDEQMMLRQEKKKQTDKGGKLTLSPGPHFTMTSTPAANKDNFIGASNFLFLSPIISEEGNVTKCSSPKQNVSAKDSPAVRLNQETPKLDTKLKRIGFRRVLRNGKILER